MRLTQKVWSTTFLVLEFDKIKFSGFMLLEFLEHEFLEFEIQKNGKSLHIFKTVVGY